MAEVGQKRSPRLSKGPKLPIETISEEEEIVIEAGEDIPDVSRVVVSNDNSNSVDSSDSGFQGIEKKLKLPEPPSKVIRDHQVSYDYMAALKPEHWLQVIWYLYRLDPKIVRPSGEEYIDKGSHALTEEYILENFGSGEYQLKFNDVGKPKNAKNVFTGYFRYNLPTHPPIINMAELDVDYKGNRRFVDQCIAKGLLTVDRKPMNTQVNQQGGGSNDQLVRLLEKLIDKTDKTQLANVKDPRDAAVSEAFAIMAKGNEAATKMMLEQMKDNDPDKLLKMVTTIMALAKPSSDNNSKNDEGMLMKFMSLMADKDKTIMDMMNKMMEVTIKASQPKENNSNSEGGDAFDKFLDRYGKMQEIMGMAGATSGGGGKKSTLEVALQYGAPVLDKAFGLIQNLLALKAMGVQPQANPGVGSVNKPTPTMPPIAISQSTPAFNEEGEIVDNDNSNPMAEAMQQTQAPVQQTQTNQGGGMQLNEEMIKRGVIELGPKILEAMNRDMPGDEFAHNLNGFLGPQAYDIIAGLGEEKIIDTLKSVPQIWQLFSMRELSLRKFVKGFIDYGKDDDDGEGEGEGKEGADVKTDVENEGKKGIIN